MYEPQGKGVNKLNHITIGVNGGTPVGFDPAKDLTTEQVVEEYFHIKTVGTPGVVEKDPGQKILDMITLRVSGSQAHIIQKYIDARTAHPCNYQDKLRNCTEFAVDALRPGGINVQTTWLPSKLMQELHNYNQQQTSQPPPPP